VPEGPVDMASAAAAVGARWHAIEEAAPDPDFDDRARRLVEGEVYALGRSLPLEELDWTGQPVNPLWTYHLHYFEPLPALYVMACRGVPCALARLVELVEGWIEATADGRGEGWDSYPTSVRIVQWLKVLAMDEAGGRLLPGGLRHAMLQSLQRQAIHLAGNLEWDLSANHLLKNLCALVWAGLLLEAPGLPSGVEHSRRRLAREVGRQVLPDGMHEERSPAYHQLVLHDLLEVRVLRKAVGDPGAGEMDAVLGSMLRVMERLTRPDGSYLLFGDSANGSAPPRERVWCMAETIAVPGEGVQDGVWSLPDAGFHGFTDHDHRLVVDCGSIGPRHQPAHGHCDALSFELDLHNVPVVVDSGVHGYAGDPFREYSRSTRAHNTVMIQGKEQSEVWGLFRVARMAEVRRVEGPTGRAAGEREGPVFHFRGACVPFHDRKVVHVREIRLESGVLRIVDEVEGGEGREVETFLHLHPRWAVELRGGQLRAWDGERELQIDTMGLDGVELLQGRMDPVQGWYLPAMGEAHPSFVLVGRATLGAEHRFGFALRMGKSG
jgi:uncharacterized heparinase superfamily protein